MACIEFDVADYLHEVSDGLLASEVRRRNMNVLYDLETIVGMLREAWREGDKVMFERALSEIVPPYEREEHAEAVRKRYWEAMKAA